MATRVDDQVAGPRIDPQWSEPGQQGPDCAICDNDCPFTPGNRLPPPPECRIRQIAEELRREFFNGG